MERFDLPTDIMMIVHDKSSWARRGLATQNTVFDPGWRGYATLELTNHGKASLIILAGDPIAQVVCHLLTEPTTQPYAGKYQDQEAGPQPARDDSSKIVALADVLKVKLPELVHVAFTQFKAELPGILPGLSDDEWTKIRDDENRRRARAKP